jgi:hypothetical protein
MYLMKFIFTIGGEVMKRVFILAIAVSLAGIATGANAQVMLSRAVIASGGHQASNGQTVGTVTTAQPVTGQASNGTTVMHYGFWTPASAPASVHQSASLASNFDLSVWPNPANTRTELALTLPSKSAVTITVYDASGHQITTQTTQQSAGRSNLALDLSGLSSGAYFVSASIPGEIVQQRFSVIR